MNTMRRSRRLQITSTIIIFVLVSAFVFIISPTIFTVFDTALNKPKTVPLEEGEFQVVSPYSFKRSTEKITTPFGTTTNLIRAYAL